jgi:tRNA-dihydrouridine synthase
MENPWLFRQIVAAQAGAAVPEPTVRERLAALRRYRVLLEETYPLPVAAARLRGMTCRTVKGFPGAAGLREAVTRTRTCEELAAELARFESSSASESRFAEAAA